MVRKEYESCVRLRVDGKLARKPTRTLAYLVDSEWKEFQNQRDMVEGLFDT